MIRNSILSLLAIVAVSHPVDSRAEFMPPGCYVADFYRLDPCWNGFGGLTEWNQYSDRNYATGYYGTAVESIIYDGKLADLALSQCNSDYNALLGLNNIAASNLAQCESNRQEWIAYGTAAESGRVALFAANKKQAALVKKLRAACGLKCKKIK